MAGTASSSITFPPATAAERSRCHASLHAVPASTANKSNSSKWARAAFQKLPKELAQHKCLERRRAVMPLTRLGPLTRCYALIVATFTALAAISDNLAEASGVLPVCKLGIPTCPPRLMPISGPQLQG